MKRNRFLTLCTILLSVRVLAATGSPESLDVQFAAPLTDQELSGLVDRTGVQPLALEYDGGLFVCGYVLSPHETLPIALLNFRMQHAEFLVNMAGSLRNAIDADETLRSETDADALLRSFEQLTGSPRNMSISAIRIRGDDDAARLLREPEVQTITPSRRSDETDARGGVRGRLESQAKERWAPTAGQAEVQRTYASQTFYWANASFFGAKSTYEAENQVYDPKFANYGGYWSSNLPYAYLDTPFGDSSSLDNFTIGSAKATSVVKNKSYFTYMSLKPQSANTAQVIIKGQLGHRNPQNCFLTWCVWPDATTKLTSFTAPGGARWK